MIIHNFANKMVIITTAQHGPLPPIDALPEQNHCKERRLGKTTKYRSFWVRQPKGMLFGWYNTSIYSIMSEFSLYHDQYSISVFAWPSEPPQCMIQGPEDAQGHPMYPMRTSAPVLYSSEWRERIPVISFAVKIVTH